MFGTFIAILAALAIVGILKGIFGAPDRMLAKQEQKKRDKEIQQLRYFSSLTDDQKKEHQERVAEEVRKQEQAKAEAKEHRKQWWKSFKVKLKMYKKFLALFLCWVGCFYLSLVLLFIAGAPIPGLLVFVFSVWILVKAIKNKNAVKLKQ